MGRERRPRTAFPRERCPMEQRRPGVQSSGDAGRCQWGDRTLNGSDSVNHLRRGHRQRPLQAALLLGGLGLLLAACGSATTPLTASPTKPPTAPTLSAAPPTSPPSSSPSTTSTSIVTPTSA